MRRVILLLLCAASGSIVLQARPINSSFSALANRADKTPTFLFQSVTVTGKVTDESGAGMPGVNVIVKGTSSGTTTDSEGGYALSLDNQANAILVFSFIGYATQEQPVNGRTTLNVTMSTDILALGEVVVVGYGEQRRSDITGSIASVSSEQIKDVPVSSLAEALQGRAAGVDIQKSGANSKPGSNPVIRIRGIRSLTGGNDPLYIVDGIPFNSNISDLNPDDIASVEVLKDASSTAIYGSRGANGVILITTKRGKVGTPIVTYSGYTGYVKNLKKFPMMNGEEFTEFKKWSRINNAAAGTYTGLDDPLFLTNGTFEPQEVESIQTGRSTDWQDLVYRKGLMTNHQIGFSGGFEKTQFAVSAGYFKETGIYAVQAFQRASLKLSIDQQIGQRFKIGMSSLNTWSLRQGEGMNPMSHVLRASPLATPYDPATGGLWGYLPGGASQVFNPLADLVKGAIVEDRKRLGTFTTLYLEAKIIEGLKYRFNAGVDLKSDVYGSFFAGNTTRTLGSNIGPDNRTSNRNRADTNYTLENLLVYDKTITEKHRINFTGLYSLQESQMNRNEFNNQANLADYLEYYNPIYGTGYTGEGVYEKWALISYMGRLNYGFNDKYLLTLTMRSDGSSRLAPGNKWQSFPSAAVAWNVAEESFMSNIRPVNSLKLRASYGRVGNAAVDVYSTQGRLSPLRYNYGTTLVTGLYPTAAPNPFLEWEYTSSVNLGLDFGLLENRITGTIEFYKASTDKLLLGQTLPLTQGIRDAVQKNVGKTENKGIEFQISTVNINGNGRNTFRWTTDINIYANRGKIVQLWDKNVKMSVNDNWFVGQPLGTIYDYKKLGIWQNTPADSALAKQLNQTITGFTSVIGTIKVEDLSGPDGVPDDRITAAYDKTFIGSGQPTFQGGITSRMAFKGFDFTVVAFGRYGSTLISRNHNSGFNNTFQANYNNLKTRFWTPENGENVYPKPTAAFTNPLMQSTLGYFDGSYVKIRSLSLGYTLPPSILDRAKMKSLRIYATVNDAFILFSPYVNKYGGLDPEATATGNSTSGRQQVETDTPPTYSVIFGLNVSF